MITGINHITLSVRDLDRSFNFYRDLLGFQPLVRWSKGAYFLAGDLWFCLTLDPKTRAEPLPEYSHLAFSVPPEQFTQLAASLQDAQARIWQPNTSDGESLYFLDPDGHKLEIHASDWRTRIEAWKKDPWTDLEFFT